MPTVWIVDDSPMAARIVCDALERDYTCVTIGSGTALLDRMASGVTPDVLVLDWELPDLTGDELCRIIRRTHDDLTLPILLVTGRRDSLVEGFAAGANDYISKPFAPAELLARVTSQARIRQLSRQTGDLEAQLSTTLRSIADAVISTDAQARIVFMNDAAERITGWRTTEAAGQPVGDVFRVRNSRTGAAAPNPVEEVLRTGQAAVVSDDCVLLRRDGTDLPVAESAAPIHGAAGELTGVVLVFRDVTAQRLAEEALERALDDARSRAEFERQLIGIVSHDLRGPLATMALGTHVLMSNERTDEGSLRSLMRIRRAVDQGQRMVNDLLDFTKARVEGGLSIVRAADNLHAVIRQVVEDMRTTFPERDIQVTTTGDGHGRFDSDRMAQVVGNLIANALKYGKGPVVDVRCDSTADEFNVSVHNHGTPIESAALERIFHPMQRATSQLENTARSVGLGLFIVKHLVEAHGGQVSVSSSHDQGTTFAFRFPKG